MKKFKIITFLFCIGFGSSCGVVPRGTIPWEPDRNPVSEPVAVPVNEISERDTPEEKELKSGLQRAFNDWKGVPYLLGGADYGGVDCSSFMQIVFGDYFSIELPRNTRDQFQVGQHIEKREVKTGDMVFFKTGSSTYHVGVMVNEVEFMHASTSNGVMISNLRNNYWQQVYFTARRVL